MSDNKSIRGPQDSARVNLNEEYEVQYWCNKFNCSREELQKAVQAVGSSAVSVEEFISSR